ncbi:MAG TPA: lipocalin-like domain-containing protein [Thermoanaerobaculia bacterium]|nr:lipocalin-like domain-containing protein [Thermoanaerobaculia bacterium]
MISDRAKRARNRHPEPRSGEGSQPLSVALPGTWQLISRTDVNAAGDVVPEASLGSDPVALLIYDRSGHFSAQFMKRDRSAIVDDSRGSANNTRARGGYDAYFGSYSIDDTNGTITQTLLGALSPENVGHRVTREMIVSGDTLTIRLTTTSSDGQEVLRTLLWKRVG